LVGPPPNVPANADLRAESHWYGGSLGDAITDYSRALELNPKDVSAFLGRGQVFMECRDFSRLCIDNKKQQYTDALNIIQKRRDIYGDSAWTWAQLAYVYGSAGQQLEARHAVQKLEELNRHKGNRSCSFRIG
jgi:tetratricopeptide (TPR) repeat protein